MEKKYLYNINCDIKKQQLCRLEISSIFKEYFNDNYIISSIDVPPSQSPFIKNKITILYCEQTLDDIIANIKRDNFIINNFKIEYLRTKADPHSHQERLNSQIAIAAAIDGFGMIKNQDVTYAIGFVNNQWYFGEYAKNDFNWHQHNDKPYSYCNAMDCDLSRSIVNIATGLDQDVKIIDPCCGIGTVVMEGLALGYNITGNELCPSISANAKKNLEAFNYPPVISTGDMHDITGHYDVAILDIPYGLMSHTSSEDQQAIINTCRKIADKIILISSIDMQDKLELADFEIIEKITVSKTHQGSFSRTIVIGI